MKQSNAMQNISRHYGSLKMRDRGTFSFETKDAAPNLKEQIRRLRAIEDSPYSGRSEADIAGMILLKKVPEELKKYDKPNKESKK